MCATCGCGDDAGPRVTRPSGGAVTAAHRHDHEHDHGSGEDHGHAGGRTHHTATVSLEQRVLAKNDQLAGHNRDWLRARGILAVNLMSSPGSGKTTLLERTLRDLAERLPVSVIEGDQETQLDALRLRVTGCEVVQINTGSGCHLDAEMLASGLTALDPPPKSVVFVENVGNLVCPALFDLGEAHRVVITSVTEGTDKPLKYPHMFRAADLVLLNKIDLLPHLEFSRFEFELALRRLNPRTEMLEVSATRGQGMAAWYDWLQSRLGAAVEPPETRLGTSP